MMGKSHRKFMIEYFRDDPAFAAFMVNSILEKDDDQGELKLILQDIAAAGLRVSLAPAKAKPRARAKAGAARVAAKPAKAVKAMKPMKAAKAAPATKRAKTAPSAKRAKATPTTMAGSAGRSRSRVPMVAAGA